MATVPPAPKGDILYCANLEGQEGKPECCTSCHEDHEADLSDMTELYDFDTDKLTHVVCCTVAAWVKRMKCL